MLRLLVILTLAAVVAYFGSTVKLGERTFFGHIRAIWSTKEAQDMRKGLDEKAGPALDRMKRGVEAGIKAAGRDDGGSPPIDAGVSDAPADAAVLPEAPLPDARPAAEPADKSDKKGAKDKKDAKKPDKVTERGASRRWPSRAAAAAPWSSPASSPVSSPASSAFFAARPPAFPSSSFPSSSFPSFSLSPSRASSPASAV